VVTQGRGRAGYRLFLNGNLQFAERDEYRYHEALVHPAMAAYTPVRAPRKRVAVLGGGDGMAVREVLKYPGVEAVTLVELDPAMSRLFAGQPHAGCNSTAMRCKAPKVQGGQHRRLPVAGAVRTDCLT
jgi:spermidine synthase